MCVSSERVTKIENERMLEGLDRTEAKGGGDDMGNRKGTTRSHLISLLL